MEEKKMVLKDGKYVQVVKGHSSDIKVAVNVDDNKISDVSINVAGETSSRNKAVEKLSNQILQKQNADIDAVSGATETSNAVKRAVSEILNQASGIKISGEKTSLKDGTYKETTPSYSLTAPMVGEVTIKDNKIKDIKITSEKDSATSHWFSVAESKFIPRLIKTQSLDTDAVTGASVSSGAIRTIAEKAINDAGGNSDEWHTLVAKQNNIVKKEDYDVIVVGLGGSGILSYCAAAKSGAKVFGMEAAAEVGGNSALTSGPMVVNSKNMSDKYNNGKDNIDEKDLYDTWIKYVGSDKKGKVIKKAIEEDGPALDYYMDNFDFSFDGASFGQDAGFYASFVRPDWTKEWTIYTPENGKWYKTGASYHLNQFKHALEKAKGMNEANDYQLELRAESLLKDNNGNVIGVQAKSSDGTTYKIYGKSVILASGGFIGNNEMMKEVYGHVSHVFGTTVSKGTGIKMGQSVGGNTYALRTLPMTHISQVPNIIRDNSLNPDQKAILSAIAITSDAKQLDETGKVLSSKDESGTENKALTVGIAYAPGFRYFNVYTKDDLDQIRDNGLSETTSQVAVIILDQGGKVPAAGTPIKDIDKIVQEAINHDNAWKGTPRELAQQLNMDVDELTKSLGDANQEYYLFEADGYAYATCGGLDVDEDMNVLRKDGSKIENLFAVGQDSEGVENVDDEAYTPWGGQAQAWTFVSGKIAGENAARVK